jgi:hypothetical protein
MWGINLILMDQDLYFQIFDQPYLLGLEKLFFLY